MREHIEQPIDLVVERMAAVGDDQVLVPVDGHGNAVERLLEQVDAGRGIETERLGTHRGGETRVDLVEHQDDVEGLGVEPWHDPVEPDEIEAQKLPRERQIFAQEIEAAEQPQVVRNQRLVLAEADLTQHVRVARDADRIAERIQAAEIDAAAMRKNLLVERDRVRLGPEQVHPQRFRAATARPELVAFGRLFARLVLALRRRAHGELQSEARSSLDVVRRQQRLQGRRAREIFGLDEIERP